MRLIILSFFWAFNCFSLELLDVHPDGRYLYRDQGLVFWTQKGENRTFVSSVGRAKWARFSGSGEYLLFSRDMGSGDQFSTEVYSLKTQKIILQTPVMKGLSGGFWVNACHFVLVQIENKAPQLTSFKVKEDCDQSIPKNFQAIVSAPKGQVFVLDHQLKPKKLPFKEHLFDWRYLPGGFHMVGKLLSGGSFRVDGDGKFYAYPDAYHLTFDQKEKGAIYQDYQGNLVVEQSGSKKTLFKGQRPMIGHDGMLFYENQGRILVKKL
jgi:hypothetical protein